jgi:hypothetical protein
MQQLVCSARCSVVRIVTVGLRCPTHGYSTAVRSSVSVNPSQRIFWGIWNHFESRRYKFIRSHTSCLLVVMFTRVLVTKLLQLFAQFKLTNHDNGKLKDWLRWTLLGCDLLHSVFPYSSLSQAKNNSATNSGMSLPLSRKQLACGQSCHNTNKWGMLDLYPF